MTGAGAGGEEDVNGRKGNVLVWFYHPRLLLIQSCLEAGAIRALPFK
jgi:hypothetical protein